MKPPDQKVLPVFQTFIVFGALLVITLGIGVIDHELEPLYPIIELALGWVAVGILSLSVCVLIVAKAISLFSGDRRHAG